VAIRQGRKRLNQARFVAAGCDELRIGAHGKEGVSSSSPEEGSAKAPHTALLVFGSTCRFWNVCGALYGAFRSEDAFPKRRFFAEPSLIQVQQARRRFTAGSGFGHISPTPSQTASPRFGAWHRPESSASGFRRRAGRSADLRRYFGPALRVELGSVALASLGQTSGGLSREPMTSWPLSRLSIDGGRSGRTFRLIESQGRHE
jgi:hypothetical protein